MTAQWIDRPQGVPENAEAQTWWVTPPDPEDNFMGIYSPGGALYGDCRDDIARDLGIPIPRQDEAMSRDEFLELMPDDWRRGEAVRKWMG